jgi:hypothetical protein
MNLLASALMLPLLFTASLGAQTIAGTVWDTTSNGPVAAARVILLQVDTSQSFVTDASGKFFFRALPGMGSLRITALGYSDASSAPFILDKDDHYSLLTYLSATPIDIMPIHVIAKTRRAPTPREEFEVRRKSSGAGYFLDEKDLERLYAAETTEFLRRIPGVIVEREFVRLRSYCREEPVFLVDGQEFRPPEHAGAPTATETVNSLVSANDVAAIEVYKDAAPPELQSGLSTISSCGVVVIWTKRR